MSTKARLERLEKELAASKRRFRRLGVVVLGLAAAGVALAWTWSVGISGPAQELVRAQSFVLEDADGTVRADWDVLATGPRLRLYDEIGQPRVALTVFENQPQVMVFDETGRRRGVLGMVDEIFALRLYDQRRQVRFALGVDQDVVGMGLIGENGETRAQLAVSEIGPELTLLDATGDVRTALGAGTSETTDGRRTSYPESSIRLAGPDGNLIWSAP